MPLHKILKVLSFGIHNCWDWIPELETYPNGDWAIFFLCFVLDYSTNKPLDEGIY